MALVGHISGSSQSQSVIGVTGSVVFANQPAASFPTLSGVGSDAVFFVSGTIGGKAAGLAKTVAVFGGDTVVSGSLTVGTGSVKITSNDIQFSSNANRIELAGSDLKFFDASNPTGLTLTSLSTGGGGGGPSYWTSVTNGEIFTTGSVVTSGSVVVKNSSEVPVVSLDAVTGDVTGSSFLASGPRFSTSQTTFDLINATATTVNFAGAATTLNIGNSSGVTSVAGGLRVGGGFDDTGVTISGAGNIRANGLLQVDGTAAITGSITLAGNSQTITHTGTGNLSISSTAGSVVVEGVTFTGNNVTIPGDLAVNGSNLTTSATSFNLLAGATTAITVGGSTTAITLGTGNTSRVNIPGDLFVQGNVTAIETTNTRVKDALILLASGSAAINSSPSAIAFASGSATNDQALIFGAGLGQDTLAAARTDVRDGLLSPNAGMYTNYVPIRASRFELGGGLSFITSSDGTTLSAQGNAANLSAVSGVATVQGSTGIILNAQSNNVSVQNNGGTVLRLSGSGASGATLDIKGGSSTTTANLFSDVGSLVSTVNVGTTAGALNFGVVGGSSTFNGNVTGSNFSSTGGTFSTTQATFNLVNTTASTVNFAGAATTLAIGNSAGTTTIAGATTVNGNTILGSDSAKTLEVKALITGSLLPNQDMQYNLGAPTLRWANMYTGDLHLRNDRGDWTIIEEPDFLTITNNRNGKRYKFVMEEIG